MLQFMGSQKFIVANGRISFFSWQNNIPLHVCVSVCLFHIFFFIRSSIDAHSSCSILAVVDIASVDMGVQIYL